MASRRSNEPSTLSSAPSATRSSNARATVLDEASRRSASSTSGEGFSIVRNEPFVDQ